MTTKWIPEIMYEESEEGSSNIPFIMVPTGETMPHLLYMFESRATGEEEPGLDGNPVPIVEWDLHQYADMAVLKDNLSFEVYDQVREALGLESMTSAVEKGKKISDKIRGNVEK
tara:strand:+ start:136 stop:477 length:342 start_codon:yes stop_codon:yes gene_type:complete